MTPSGKIGTLNSSDISSFSSINFADSSKGKESFESLPLEQKELLQQEALTFRGVRSTYNPKSADLLRKALTPSPFSSYSSQSPSPSPKAKQNYESLSFDKTQDLETEALIHKQFGSFIKGTAVLPKAQSDSFLRHALTPSPGLRAASAPTVGKEDEIRVLSAPTIKEQNR